MADEQAQGEVETPIETPAVSEEQPSEEVADSEVANTPTDTDRGDLRVALKQERERRQELERSLTDQNFIYQQAVRLGLAEEGDAPQPQSQNLYQVAEEIYEYKEAVRQFPEAESDPEIAELVDGLVRRGKKPAEAVKTIQKRLTTLQDKVKTEAIQQRDKEITAKERAQTATSISETNPEAEEMAQLTQRAKSLDPRVQKDAMLEFLKRQNKKEGII